MRVIEELEEARDRTANDDVGQQGEDCGNDEHSGDGYAIEFPDLVDRIKNAGDDEDLSDVAPAVADVCVPSRFVCENSPEKRRVTFAGVADAGADGEEDGNERLNDEAKPHGTGDAAKEVGPDLVECVAHRSARVHAVGVTAKRA